MGAAWSRTSTAAQSSSSGASRKPPSPPPELSAADVAAARAAFRAIDTSGEGSLELDEVAEALRRLHLRVDPEALERAFAQMDQDGDTHVSLEEFVVFYRQRVAALRAAYDEMCRLSDSKHGKGLTAAAVRIALRRLGQPIADENLTALLELADADKDGRLSFAEFRDFLLLLPCDNNARAVFDNLRYQLPFLFIHGFAQQVLATEGDAKHPDESYSEVAVKLGDGAVAGAISRTATAPIDRIRVLMQAGAAGALQFAANRSVFLETIRHIYSTGGLRGFYFGNGVSVLKTIPDTATLFFTFDLLSATLAADKDNLTPAERFCIGGLSGATAQSLVYPLDKAKTRISLSGGKHYTGLFDCLHKIWLSQGFRGFYSGLEVSLLGIVPFAGIDLGINSFLRDRASKHYAALGIDPPIPVLLGCGMVSSSAAIMATYPIGLLRTKMQASGLSGAVKYASTTDCLRQTLQARGWRGLYRGLLPTLFKVVPSTSIGYTVYALLGRYHRDSSKGADD